MTTLREDVAEVDAEMLTAIHTAADKDGEVTDEKLRQIECYARVRYRAVFAKHNMQKQQAV